MFDNLKKFLFGQTSAQKTYNVHIILKSGTSFDFDCYSCKFDRDDVGNIIDYNIESDFKIWLDVNSIDVLTITE